MISAALLDLSGVVYQGDNALPGAQQAISLLRKHDIALRFLTNTTRSNKPEILEKLHEFGVTCDESELFTPAEAACLWMTQNGYRPHLLVHSKIKSQFENVPPSDKVAVVVGDAGQEFDYNNLNLAFRVLQEGAPLIALATNRYFLDKDEKLSLDAGPFVTGLEFASDREAILMGKPAQSFFDLALDGTGATLQNTAMIGDDVKSDVSGALSAGIAVGILVRTGKYLPNDESTVQPPPTTVADNILDAAKWIVDHNQHLA